MVPYKTNNGCSVRIGRGISHSRSLLPKDCYIYEFVETVEEVKVMMKLIRNLPKFYRQKDESLEVLNTYLSKII